MDYRKFLEIRADKRFGKPCIKGTRITVYDVLNWLSNGMSREDTKSDFEELTDEMINAYLAYAADKERRLISVTRIFYSIIIPLNIFSASSFDFILAN